jgi:methyl-accepting chemotaxis protein
MSFALPGRFRMTIGRRIYALIGLSILGLLGIGALDSRELASSLRQQKQIELRHLGELALGIVKEEHAVAQKGGSRRCDMATTIISGSTTCSRAWSCIRSSRS